MILAEWRVLGNFVKNFMGTVQIRYLNFLWTYLMSVTICAGEAIIIDPL